MSEGRQDFYHSSWITGDPEARRYERAPAHGFVLRNPVPGQVVDISAGGLGVASSRALRTLERISFTLGLGNSVKTLHGEVRWCRLAGTTRFPNGDVVPTYRAGIAFLSSHSRDSVRAPSLGIPLT